MNAASPDDPEPANELAALLAAARRGSRPALGQLLDNYRNVLLKLAAARMADDLQAKAGASDLVQESLLEAHRDFAGFNGGTDIELLTWLRRILMNNVLNLRRRFRGTDKRQVALEEALDGGQAGGEATREFAADTASPSGQLMARERIDALKQALQRLPEEFRRVIELHQQENFSWEEIGARMDRSADAVRKLWGRAIRRLRDEMGPSETLSG